MRLKSILLLSVLLSTHSYGASHKNMQPQSVPTYKRYYALATIGEALPAGKFSSVYTNPSTPSLIFGGGLGYNFNKEMSADFTVNHRYKLSYDDSVDKQKIVSTRLMLSSYYSIPFQMTYLYLAAGTGTAYSKIGAYTVGGATMNQRINGWKFAWQIGPGVRFRASENILIDLGYRYVSSGNFTSAASEEGKSEDVRIRTHEVMLSAIYKF